MKKILSIVISVLLLAPSVSALDIDQNSNYVQPFSDFGWGDTYYDSVEWMHEQQVIQGYGDGTFKPDNCVNRAEFLKMLYIMSEKSLESGLVEFFPDVDANDWFYSYVTNAVDDEVVQGYSDGYFRPGICVNRAEAMKMAVILMLSGQAVNSSAPLYYDDKIIADMHAATWYSKYARFLFMNRLVGTSHTVAVNNPSSNAKQIYFYPDGGMTRAEVAEMLYRIKAYIDGGQSPDPLPVFCTTEARAGLVVDVTSEANMPISGVSFLVDGKSADFYSSDSQPGMYSGLFEQSGEFDITAKKDGYIDYEFEVSIDADVCHVVTENVDVELVYESFPTASRNAQRRSDVNMLLNAMHQYSIDNSGVLPSAINSNATVVGSNAGELNICSYLIDIYLAKLPSDPVNGYFNNCSSYSSGYQISVNSSGRVTVSAPYAELGESISVSR